MNAASLNNQIADAVEALFYAEAVARVAREDATSYAGSQSRFESPEALDARERLKAANYGVGVAMARRNDLIRELHAGVVA